MKKKTSSTGESIFLWRVSMMFLKDVFEPTDLLLFIYFFKSFTVLCCSKSEKALQLLKWDATSSFLYTNGSFHCC